jgi:single-stranded-DNA-specific exonuclease
VAYKFCQALTGSVLEEDLDLVSLGTIADSVPLTGENRIIAKAGLSVMRRTKRPGLVALMESSGIKDKEITPEFVSFILGPRINASGRMDTAEVSLNLLMSQHKDEASRLAKALELHNRQRQKVENEILEEAHNLINTEVNFKEHKIVVVAGNGWHQGVLGIVAAKLADKFNRPTIVISMADGLCRGSGRSANNFHLFNGLSECSELLENFGGHEHAVGLVIAKDNIQNFKDKINRLAKEKLSVSDLMLSLEIDMELSLSQINDSFIRELDMLEPFGAGNPEPLFYTKGLKVKNEPLVLSRDTLKLWVTDGNFTYPAIGFGMGSFKESLRCCDSFDLVYTPRIDNWQGRESLILEIKEVFCK